MDLAMHHIIEGIIDQAMALKRGFVAECGGCDPDDVMPATAGRTRMSRMFCTFVNNTELLGLQLLLQPFPNPFRARLRHSGQDLVEWFDGDAFIDAGGGIGVGVRPGTGILQGWKFSHHQAAGKTGLTEVC